MFKKFFENREINQDVKSIIELIGEQSQLYISEPQVQGPNWAAYTEKLNNLYKKYKQSMSIRMEKNEKNISSSLVPFSMVSRILYRFHYLNGEYEASNKIIDFHIKATSAFGSAYADLSQLSKARNDLRSLIVEQEQLNNVSTNFNASSPQHAFSQIDAPLQSRIYDIQDSFYLCLNSRDTIKYEVFGELALFYFIQGQQEQAKYFLNAQDKAHAEQLSQYMPSTSLNVFKDYLEPENKVFALQSLVGQQFNEFAKNYIHELKAQTVDPEKNEESKTLISMDNAVKPKITFR